MKSQLKQTAEKKFRKRTDIMIPVNIYEEYEVGIDDYCADGNGICHIKGYTVFVPEAIKGDRLKIMIVKTKPKIGYGVISEIIELSEYRVEERCPYFKKCGGCQIMYMNYDGQINYKKDIITGAMKKIGTFGNFKLDEFIRAESDERYRNKMTFPVGMSESGEPVCGFYAMKTHDVVPLGDCIIGNEMNESIINTVLDYVKEYKVPVYDEKEHKGIIRRVFIRCAKNTDEIMVVICANARSLPHEEALYSALAKLSDRIKSVVLNINLRHANFALGDENRVLYGKDRINDILCGIKFKISASSFFQVNPVQTELLYKKAMEYADLTGEETVMDVYCGIGSISLCAAKRAKNVIGIELVKSAVEDARNNAIDNKIDNVKFYSATAEKMVPKLIARGIRPDVVFLDPPRRGSDEKTLEAITRAKPEKIVYISCNPATLARDARYLREHGYKLIKSAGVDMFPNTIHVETITLLQRRDM